MPVLEDILEMGSKNKNGAHKIFFEHFIPPFVGRISYRTKVMGSLISKFTSRSDEALALLILDNSWNKWQKINSSEGNSAVMVKTKYTADSQGSGAKKYNGWQRSGLARFNELMKAVDDDRADPNHSIIENMFLEESKERSTQSESLSMIEDFVEVLDDLPFETV